MPLMLDLKRHLQNVQINLYMIQLMFLFSYNIWRQVKLHNIIK